MCSEPATLSSCREGTRPFNTWWCSVQAGTGWLGGEVVRWGCLLVHPATDSVTGVPPSWGRGAEVVGGSPEIPSLGVEGDYNQSCRLCHLDSLAPSPSGGALCVGAYFLVADPASLLGDAAVVSSEEIRGRYVDPAMVSIELDLGAPSIRGRPFLLGCWVMRERTCSVGSSRTHPSVSSSGRNQPLLTRHVRMV